MKRIMLIGPPCVGKSTFASILSKHFNIPSVGLRLDPSKSYEGKKLNKNRDSTYWDLLKQAIETLDSSSGYIIEGYPRNIEQVILMEVNKLPYDVIVHLYQPKDIITAKSRSRFICPKCNSIYNTEEVSLGNYFMPKIAPKVEMVCDICQSNLVKRKEDEQQKLNRRYFEYLVDSEAIKNYFEKKQKFLHFDVYSGIEDSKRLISSIEAFYSNFKLLEI